MEKGKTFTVQEFLQRVKAGEEKNMISKSIGLHRSTIPGVMKRLGYQIDKPSGGYIWAGSGEEPLNYNLLSGAKRTNGKPDSQVIASDSDEIASASDTIADDSNRPAGKNSPAKIIFIQDDKRQVKEKYYRGYYLEVQLTEIMDSIKNKSEVVNDALREYFQNRGIL